MSSPLRWPCLLKRTPGADSDAALLAAHGSEGGTYVSTSRSRVLLDSSTEPERGIPSVRVIES